MCYVHISSEVPSITAETIKKIENAAVINGTISKNESDTSQLAFESGSGISLVFAGDD